MSQPRDWAGHVVTDVATCWSPGVTDVGDGSGHLGNPTLGVKMSVPMSIHVGSSLAPTFGKGQ
eukprot:11407655-Karenia_brevis.AAC.1